MNTLSSSIYIVPVVMLTITWNITRFNELTTCYTTVPVMIMHMVLLIMVMIIHMVLLLMVMVMMPIVMLIGNGFDVLDIRLRSWGPFVLVKYRQQNIWS